MPIIYIKNYEKSLDIGTYFIIYHPQNVCEGCENHEIYFFHQIYIIYTKIQVYSQNKLQ